MFSIETLLILIPGLPLAACLTTALLGAKVLRERSHLPVVAGIAGSCVCSLMLLFAVMNLADSAGPRSAGPQSAGPQSAGPQSAGSQSVGVERIYTLWNWADLPDAYQIGSGVSRPFQIAV